MRRVLTTLMILLVVLVAGLSALVLLVNPNDFRAYMVRQVEARSGYELKLDGPLRWHVWPQLSILSGRMSLTAPGAAQPLVTADNMRLDVALIPLLSHQLQVEQVMLKGAVIQLTPQTEAVRQANAPVAPRENTLPDVPSDTGWSFDIGNLKVADSVLVSSMRMTNRSPSAISTSGWSRTPTIKRPWSSPGGSTVTSAISTCR